MASRDRPESGSQADALDPAEHRALVEDLPSRLYALVSAGVMSPTEANECLRRAHEVLTDRLDKTPGPP